MTSQLCFCFSKTMKSLFGTLELRSFNLFLFYLTTLYFQCTGNQGGENVQDYFYLPFE